MARPTGLGVSFDRSLIWAVLALAVLGPRWIMNLTGASWTVASFATLLAGISILLGVIIHEYGHALLARFLGVMVRGIKVSWWGGSTSLGPSTFGASAAIAVAGPLVNGFFAALIWLGSEYFSPSPMALGLHLGAWINAFLTIFNLLPFAPLDGSHAVSDLVAKATGSREQGEQVVAWLGISVIPLSLAWIVWQGLWHYPPRLVLLVVLIYLIWSYSFGKLKQVDSSRKSGFLVKMMCSPASPVEAGTPVAAVPAGQDVVVRQRGQLVGYVPASLVGAMQEAGQNLLIEQLTSPLAPEPIEADTRALDLSEYAQGHHLVLARRALGEGSSPVWAVTERGRIIGTLNYDRHLAHITEAN